MSNVAKPAQILLEFSAQEWQNDRAVEIWNASKDATDLVLNLSLEEIHNLEDCSDSSDGLGQTLFPQHSGPYSVYVTSSICDFFAVENLSEITLEMVQAKKAERAARPKQEFEVTVTRTATASRTIRVSAADATQAEALALEKAPDEVFREDNASYAASNAVAA